MKKNRKKRSTISYKDIQISYLVDGIESISKLHKEGLVRRIALRRALQNLKTTGLEAGSFEQWILENLGGGTRGRRAPMPEQERTYRVQQIKKSGPFLRLPLGALQVEKGEVLSVNFQNDQIVVKKSKLSTQIHG